MKVKPNIYGCADKTEIFFLRANKRKEKKKVTWIYGILKSLPNLRGASFYLRKTFLFRTALKDNFPLHHTSDVCVCRERKEINFTYFQDDKFPFNYDNKFVKICKASRLSINKNNNTRESEWGEEEKRAKHADNRCEEWRKSILLRYVCFSFI